MTIDFLPQPWVTFPQRDVLALMVQARDHIEALNQRQGDTLLHIPYAEEYKELKLVVTIDGWPTSPRRIRLSELNGVLTGFWMKMAHEGFQRRRCRYRRTEQPAGVQWMGTLALIGWQP